jgi:hypothetical protein
MAWSHLLAYFFAGIFGANFVPHFVAGVLGRELQTPFAKPPFQGLSPPRVNVLWALANLALAYSLLAFVGEFELRRVLHVGVFGLGLTAWSLMLARSFGRLYAGKGSALPSGH